MAYPTIVNSISPYNPNLATNSSGNGDPRTELFLANCRQRTDICGGAATIPAVSAVGMSTATQ